MKNISIIILAAMCMSITGCKVVNGCPSNGRNVGAERVLTADKKTLKAIKRAGKFRS